MTLLRITALAAIVILFSACSSKKIKAEQAANGGLSAQVTDQDMSFAPEGSDSDKIVGLKTVHFDFDRAVIDETALEQLRVNAKWIKSHPEMKIQIEGHCDSRGSVEYNLALGDRRAKSVARELEELGIPKQRLSTISYGEEKPIASGDTDEAYAKNRRANFVPLK